MYWTTAVRFCSKRVLLGRKALCSVGTFPSFGGLVWIFAMFYKEISIYICVRNAILEKNPLNHKLQVELIFYFLSILLFLSKWYLTEYFARILLRNWIKEIELLISYKCTNVSILSKFLAQICLSLTAVREKMSSNFNSTYFRIPFLIKDIISRMQDAKNDPKV